MDPFRVAFGDRYLELIVGEDLRGAGNKSSVFERLHVRSVCRGKDIGLRALRQLSGQRLSTCVVERGGGAQSSQPRSDRVERRLQRRSGEHGDVELLVATVAAWVTAAASKQRQRRRERNDAFNHEVARRRRWWP